MRISHNLIALNAQNNFNVVMDKRAKSAEKLSTGYRINRAADDAAGLAISEKMRRQIRGLDQGTENAQDGASWVQIGDGALNEAHDILHRMTELTVKALNGTNTDADRMAMELEFENLQSELDRISETTKFNEIPIFDEHQVPYYQCEGDVKWNPQQMHVVTNGKNDLTFKYHTTTDGQQETMTITVPPGEYTTQELIDEIDTILNEQNGDDETIIFEFTKDGYCNVNLEGGEEIDSVSGNLSYLMYDMYKGGGYGALIGTTSFPNEYSRLKVVSGQNNSMSFTIEDFVGGSQNKQITIPDGNYTRSQLIDYLNSQLTDTTVKATAYGSGIRLASDEAIVTGFKGNMFKIDGNGTVYNSVFYDNVKYGSVTQTSASFTGGYVLPTDSRDVEHKYYEIDSTNNALTLRPNGMSNPVTLTIPDGKYTAAQMATKLNELFAAQGMDLTASLISSGGFDGLKVVSNIKGLDSQINFDTNSSAYKELFVTKEYNQYGTKISPVSETQYNKEGEFRGSKDLSSLTTTPLVITAGVNDAFKIALTTEGVTEEYTITLTAKTYNSVGAVESELNNQLNGSSALAGYKDKVTAKAVNNQIRIVGNEGQKLDKVQVTAITDNNAFDDIFQGYRVITTNKTVSGKGSVTLNTPYDGDIDASESNMKITVDDIEYNVTLPTGDVSKDDIKKAIEEAIPPRTETTPNIFPAVSDTGETGDRNFSKTATGTETIATWNSSATGSSEEKEGVVGFVSSTPAVLTVGVGLKNSMPVDSSNNQISLKLNGVTKTITLDGGTYTPASLKEELQSKIDDAFGTGMGGATVGINNNKLVLTSRLPAGEDGKETSISCGTSSSSFLKELATTRTAAEWKSDRALASSIIIDDSNRTFSFNYKEDGSTKNISLTLDKDTYNQSSIVEEINEKLTEKNVGVTASLSSGKLVLTSDAVGDDVSISYATTSGGSSAEALFGPLTQPSPANAVVDLKTETSIVIEAGTSDNFSIYVNGVKKNVTLDAETYNRSSFVTMLNKKFTAAGIGIEAYVSGDKLGYKTTASGSSQSFSINYDDGGNSMKAIYGETTKEYSGVKVSFDGDDKMSLGTTKATSTISVSSGSGGAFQQPVVTKTKINTNMVIGYHSTKTSYIDGASLSGDITIDKWNNTLQFNYIDEGTGKTVQFNIPDGTYSYADLQTKLQELLDNHPNVGTGKIVATVGTTGVRLEMVNPGKTNRFGAFVGDFYDKIICGSTEKSVDLTPENINGNQIVDSTYTVGRKDVKSGGVNIRRGISDEISLDLTYGGTVHKLSMTLDDGTYSANAIKRHLQEKINEQLVAIGLPENLVEVGIGGISTGVYGANDQNALNFSLSKTIKAPDEGQFIIDGVSGSAAFEVFYQTDGKLEPAYIMGTKDVSKGVTIKDGETDLEFLVDGVSYEVTVPAGKYTADEMLDAMNDGFGAAGAPLVAELQEGKIKVLHRKMGEHDIQEVTGGAKTTVFFSENGQKEPNDARYVKLSSQENDKINLNRHIFNTPHLRLNSCCISKSKYAEKALGRIKEAISMVSYIRSDFGSTQNRLEHAIYNNENKEENLQSAESVIRDTDMAAEMVAYSNHGILMQAGQSMLAQANQLPERILALLQ